MLTLSIMNSSNKRGLVPLFFWPLIPVICLRARKRERGQAHRLPIQHPVKTLLMGLGVAKEHYRLTWC